MTLPSPQDPAQAPVWENYIVAQSVQALLGQVPQHALAVGVEVNDLDVKLIFQLSAVTPEDVEDIESVVSELEGFVGPDVNITYQRDLSSYRQLGPPGPVCWIFAARVD